MKNNSNKYSNPLINSLSLIKAISLFFVFTIAEYNIQAQDLETIYNESFNYKQKYDSLYYNNIISINSIKERNDFWYLVRTQRGNEFVLIQTDKKKSIPAFDQLRLAKSLEAMLEKKDIKPYDLPFKSIEFNKSLDSISFSIERIDYSFSLKNYTLIRKDTKGRQREQSGYWGKMNKEDSQQKILSPDKKREAYISEGNLWMTDLLTKKTQKLSYDGTVADYYSSEIHWSPDSKKIVCCRIRPGGDRKLLMIASSPKDQLQPKTETYDYAKPGDALPIRRPVLYHVDEGKTLEFDFPNIENQYNLNKIRWNKTSDSFTFHFNRRGHQQYLIYKGNLDGKIQTIVDEKAETFIFYNKLYEYWMEDTGELLWISERDGWRHLYLYDINTGKVKKQLTKGEWIVKSVVRVDEKSRKMIVIICGKDADEDPYLEKYYSLNIDNGELVNLTPENANHSVTFNHDYSYFVDSYSRVDLSPTVVVRSAADGKIVFKIDHQADITKMLEAGYKIPEVFSAKGRDGKTDIWGIIMRPSNFDPQKKYPVVEYIYAGPHDSFVPKSFSISKWGTEMLELGFIVVQIDGMGTANRSKAFHDVCWKNLKDAGFPDRIAWMKAAAEKYPEMNIEQVGIYGCSAGGQSAMGALLFHPEFYKVGYAACGCHDNRMDKIWWNEQWMGYPVGKEYEESSNVINAHKLQGKLMLLLGELDNNVDPSSTLQVVDELIKNKKDFEFVMLPNERHTMGGEYGERKRKDFFVKHLLGMEIPNWNQSK